MAVMPAGMHASGMGRAVREIVEFVDVQRVHIGAQRNSSRTAAGADGADHARSGETPLDCDAELCELGGDKVGSPALLECGFGMGVEIVPPSLHFLVHDRNGIEDRHRFDLLVLRDGRKNSVGS